MPSWWGRSSSKEVKKKSSKDLFDSLLFRKLRTPSDEKGSFRSSRGSRRRSIDTTSERGSGSRAQSRSPSPSTQVSRCQSFAERPHAQPLPLPSVKSSLISRTESGISVSQSVRSKCGKTISCLPLPLPERILNRPDASDVDGGIGTASISSDCSVDSEDGVDPHHHIGFGHLSPKVLDPEFGGRTIATSPINSSPKNSREMLKPSTQLPNNQSLSTSPKRGPFTTLEHPPNLQIPHYGAFASAPDSSLSSPSRSPMRVFGSEQHPNRGFWATKPYPDAGPFGSGHCSSPGSGQNSGHNSMGGDISGQLFCQHSRGSPECSPIPSPRMTSPGPSSRVHSGAVTPLHPRAGGAGPESPSSWPEEGKHQCHRLPLPPLTISTPSPFSPSSSMAAGSSPLPRSPGKAENPPSPGSRWKKGKLLGRGTFGHVYLGFNNESGEMCAMKEVTLFSDDSKSKESVKQLAQEIALLSRLRHQNIVQYFGSETKDDKLYIYLEYVSGGSIHKLLQEYGQFGEPVIRSYTQQILSGLAYLHNKNTVHRDIKGANILVDPNGRVKLADFGMAKHITGYSCPLSFKGSPYWMAPEVIRNANGCNLAVDIWSLGCTVLEMATTKPPWNQYEGVAAMFKIGNSKEIPTIPDLLSEEGKDFVRCCLQRNPADRPTAAQLLEHPFVKNAAPLAKPTVNHDPSDPASGVPNGMRSPGVGHARNLSSLDMEGMVIQQPRGAKPYQQSSDNQMPRNVSLPVSPTGSPLLQSRSPHHISGRMSPSPISSPIATSGSSTPLTGGNGAIPFHHIKQTTSNYMHEGYGSLPRSPNNLYLNGTSYHDPNPDLFRPDCSPVFGNAFPPRSVQYTGQAALAQHVSQQLLRNPTSPNPSVDQRSGSPLPGRSNGP
ncbi:mitogen-activated protein kinase kinase kinase YODA isoform X2 [Amborella trichopoda]|uniref:mitogen-activated protein kinase kinase kinase YODA isoform X2 n=1 Tax=Amborella trichopoda TaxID=13333 RepID=UPI0005D3E090|nr:mitogen-activated protein kinase kinase kinase YODA isoform X2 [Amborella trichopoda]|eukprot:XP_011624929.1 mitogen-activated protein kinase kinase kinase YODA isoform X2 [Amborella trichopoda]